MAQLKADVFIQWHRKLDASDKAVQKARTTALRRSAAYVWRVAKNSIKRSQKTEKHTWIDGSGREREIIRYKPSPVGKPPFEHGHWWKDSFHFEVDEANGEAYIGPIDGKRHIAPLHEFGGEGVVRWTKYIGHDRVKMQKTVSFDQRPTMRPALDKAQPKLADFWKNVI